MSLIRKLLFTLLLPSSSFAQDYVLTHITDETGLPQNSVKAIASDNAGYLWLATENGAVRYDGLRFQLYDKGVTGLSSNRVSDFRKGADNELYALHEGKQLILLKDGKAIRTGLNYRTLLQKLEYNIEEPRFIATGLPNQFRPYAGNAPYLLNTKDRNYIFTRDSVTESHRGNVLSKYYFRYPDYWGIFPLNNKLYYMDKDRSIRLIQPGATRHIKTNLSSLSPSQETSDDMLVWNNYTGDIFLCIGDKLYELKQGKNENEINFSFILQGINFKRADIKSIHWDRANNKIFAGSQTTGMYIYTKKLFQAYSPYHGDFKNFYALVSNGPGSVLFSNGIQIDTKGKSQMQKSFAGDAITTSILKTRSGFLLSAKDKKLYRFSPDGSVIDRTYPIKMNLLSLYERGDESILAGTDNNIQRFRLNDDETFTSSDYLKIPGVVTINESGTTLWMGSSRGLWSYDSKTKILKKYAALAGKQIRDIFIEEGRVWIATYGDGYYLYDKGKITSLPVDHREYLKTAHCFLEDKLGYFWISTNKGLFRILKSDLLDYSKSPGGKVYYQYFNRNYGLLSNEFNGGCSPCASIVDNNLFAFPSMGGPVFFDPESVKTSNPDKKIYIDEVRIDNVLDKINDDVINLEQDFNKLQITFSSPYYGNPENLNFEYKLDTHPHWTRMTDHEIKYYSLPYGDHKVLIRKLAGTGLSNYQYKAISIRIRPYFWQTTLFQVSAVLALILAFYAFNSWRYRYIRRKNDTQEKYIQERTNDLSSTIGELNLTRQALEQKAEIQQRLITAITHDIRNPLKYMQMTAESLYKEAQIVQPNISGLKAMYTSSSQLYNFTENLLNYASAFGINKAEAVDVRLHDFVLEKVRIFEPILNSNMTTVVNRINPDLIISVKKQVLSVIIHNLLDNATKFTLNGTISFDAFVSADQIKIIITDTGSGMSEEKMKWYNSRIFDLSPDSEKTRQRGLGLIMVKELVHSINGEIKLESNETGGTKITVSFA